jgi:uncharacterized protein (TIGR00255 family)
MTGFGKAEVELAGRKFTVEIKSLNGKSLDVTTRIPNSYREKDLEIRNLLLAGLERGKIEFTLTADVSDKSGSLVSHSAVKAYYREIREICDSIGEAIPADWLSAVLKQTENMKPESAEIDAAEWNAVQRCIDGALKAINDFRTQEGTMLESVFREKIANIGALLAEIEQYEPERLERLRSRFAESLLKQDAQGQIDENRFEQEMIFYIERLDVSEEKSRLANHLRYFIETLENEKSQGRKLGFISQEIGREINTLGSKSNHAEMQKTVVRMKDELEQIKEQVLNVL